jgi:hypothetical protein
VEEQVVIKVPVHQEVILAVLVVVVVLIHQAVRELQVKETMAAMGKVLLTWQVAAVAVRVQ